MRVVPVPTLSFIYFYSTWYCTTSGASYDGRNGWMVRRSEALTLLDEAKSVLVWALWKICHETAGQSPRDIIVVIVVLVGFVFAGAKSFVVLEYSAKQQK